VKVTVNGKPRTVSHEGDAMPLPAFLDANKVNPKLVAVAINGDVIEKESYASAVVREGDALEIVRMVGGGSRRHLPEVP
jgi:thiamine biosynthesis protein ThiS